jgi:hypothetical protein
MTKTLQIYVKATSNCGGMPLQTFELLSPVWRGDSVYLPFGEPQNTRRLKVVGWTDLFNGSACLVEVAKVRASGKVGWLVWGGNSGVRILDAHAESNEFDSHLPCGYGCQVIWVEDCDDLPDEVRRIVCG